MSDLERLWKIQKIKLWFWARYTDPAVDLLGPILTAPKDIK